MSPTSKWHTWPVQFGALQCLLHPLKSVLLPEWNAIVIADVHIGKSAHFRRHGIPLPKQVNQMNFWNLVELIEDTQPQKLLFLGDIIHSKENNEWADFIDFLDQYPELERVLIRGNHDAQEDLFFQKSGFQVVDHLKLEDVILSHEPLEKDNELNMVGHIHPAIVLTGRAKQHLRLPCFAISGNRMMVPAFGHFTGMCVIQAKKGDHIFAIAENKVLEVSAKK